MATSDTSVTPRRAALYDLNAVRQCALPQRVKSPASGWRRYVNRAKVPSKAESIASKAGQNAGATLAREAATAISRAHELSAALAATLAGTTPSQHRMTTGRTSMHDSTPSVRDPIVTEMLEGLKEIERLRERLTTILRASESGRYQLPGLRMLIRQVCADALNLDDAEREREMPTVMRPALRDVKR